MAASRTGAKAVRDGRVDDAGMVHLVEDPEYLLVMVNGGLGSLHVSALHSFGPTCAVTRVIESPEADAMTVRVFDLFGMATARVREEFPDVEVVDLSGPLPPPDGSTEILFGGWDDEKLLPVSARGLGLGAAPGTGIDGVPRDVFDRVPVVTCARGASAVPISEYVLAVMLAFVKGLPGSWIDAPPERWNFQRMDTLAGQTLGARRVSAGSVARWPGGRSRSTWTSGRCAGPTRRARWPGSRSYGRSPTSWPTRTTWCWPRPARTGPDACSTPTRSRRCATACTW